MFGWLYLLVATPAAIGALATFFAELLLGLFGAAAGRRGASPCIAAATILALSLVNLLGARLGSAVQTLPHGREGGRAAGADPGRRSRVRGGSFAHLAPAAAAARNLGSGAASVIWAYDGWIAVSMIAGEVVAAGAAACGASSWAACWPSSLLYVRANVGYFYAMPVEAMAREAGGVPQRIMADRPRARGRHADRGRHHVQRVRRPQRQHPGQAARRLRAGPRRPDVLVPGPRPSALGDAVRRHPHPGRGGHRRWWPCCATSTGSRRTSWWWSGRRCCSRWARSWCCAGKQPDAPRPFHTPGYPWVPLVFLVGTAAGLVAIVWGEHRSAGARLLAAVGPAHRGRRASRSTALLAARLSRRGARSPHRPGRRPSAARPRSTTGTPPTST